ncbi:uncharacterized protein FTOL_13959 [Fusarium torulosum]|uniref:Uncharacterized protein n=1 Tax=Fusarium torulosum TaxID=33205 RepID=A0AAE8MN34_9HYPO|nr:uncharacterized protein FTOL_13959 [Fusarium torulosum]
MGQVSRREIGRQHCLHLGLVPMAHRMH